MNTYECIVISILILTVGYIVGKFIDMFKNL